jgi:hypothetical protein
MKAAKPHMGSRRFNPDSLQVYVFGTKHILDGKEINIISQNSIYLQLCLEISVNNMHTANATVVVRCQLVMTLVVSSQEHVTYVRDYSGEKMRRTVNSWSLTVSDYRMV